MIVHSRIGPSFLLFVAVCIHGELGCRPGQRPASGTVAEGTGSSIPPSVAIAPDVSRPPGNDDWFEDATETSGVRFSYRNGQDANGFTLLESVGGGVALFDYDRDGDVDLFFTGGGSISLEGPGRVSGRSGTLYRNDGDFRFSDVTESAELNLSEDYSHGCTVADYDRDGWLDLLVTCFGQCQLFHNEQNGRFRDVALPSGIVTDRWCTAAAWGDIDQDGYVDLYVAGYVEWKFNPTEDCRDRTSQKRDVCLPNLYRPARGYLFHNRRDGTFEEISEQSGLHQDGRGLGLAAFDFNNDGWLDFYLANDAGANQLFLGSAEGRFTDQATAAGCAFNEVGAPEGSMGVGVADYDGDGNPDLFVTNFEFEDNSLYHNDGTGHFVHTSVIAGLSGRCKRYVGFGTVFADFNFDSWPDLVISNGHVQYHRPPYRQPAVLFQNAAGKRFRDVSESGGPYFSLPHVGRGLAAGDLDNDGSVDLVIVHQNDPVALLRNRLGTTDWFGIELRGEKSNPDAIGATVSAEIAGRTVTQFVVGGGSYLSQSDPRILFPLVGRKGGQDATGSHESNGQVPPVTVHWPNGRRERFLSLRVGRYNLLREGTGESQ